MRITYISGSIHCLAGRKLQPCNVTIATTTISLLIAEEE
jgi:hypothetical protein